MGYTVKIASLDEMTRKWDYEIKAHIHEDDFGNWVIWKRESIENAQNGLTLPYYGILDGEIICEATAVIDRRAAQNSDGLISNRNPKTAYLCAFRTNEGFRGRGYFSKLLRVMLSDLKTRGFERVTLGVEPQDCVNKERYFHYGFTEYIKTAKERYPDGTVIEVEYYGKGL